MLTVNNVELVDEKIILITAESTLSVIDEIMFKQEGPPIVGAERNAAPLNVS